MNSQTLEIDTKPKLQLFPPYFSDGLIDGLSQKEITFIRRYFNIFDDHLLKSKGSLSGIKNLNNKMLSIAHMHSSRKRIFARFVKVFNKHIESNINYMINNNSKIYLTKFWGERYIIILDRIDDFIADKRCFNLDGKFISKVKETLSPEGVLYREGEFFMTMQKDLYITRIKIKSKFKDAIESLDDISEDVYQGSEEKFDNTTTSFDEVDASKNSDYQETSKEKVSVVNPSINEKFQMYIKTWGNKTYEILYRETVAFIKILLFALVFLLTLLTINYLNILWSYINWMYERLTKIWESTIPVLNRDLAKISEIISEKWESLTLFISHIDWHDWGLIFEETESWKPALPTGYLWLILDKNPLVLNSFNSLQRPILTSNFINNQTLDGLTLTDRMLQGLPLTQGEIFIPFWQWCLAVAAVIVVFAVGRKLWDGWVRSNEELMERIRVEAAQEARDAAELAAERAAEATKLIHEEIIQKIRDEAAQQVKDAGELAAEMTKVIREESDNLNSRLQPRIEDSAQKTDWVKEVTDKGLLTQKQLSETENQLKGTESLLSARESEIYSLNDNLTLKADELRSIKSQLTLKTDELQSVKAQLTLKAEELVQAYEDVEEMTVQLEKYHQWILNTMKDNGIATSSTSISETLATTRSLPTEKVNFYEYLTKIGDNKTRLRTELLNALEKIKNQAAELVNKDSELSNKIDELNLKSIELADKNSEILTLQTNIGKFLSERKKVGDLIRSSEHTITSDTGPYNIGTNIPRTFKHMDEFLADTSVRLDCPNGFNLPKPLKDYEKLSDAAKKLVSTIDRQSINLKDSHLSDVLDGRKIFLGINTDANNHSFEALQELAEIWGTTFFDLVKDVHG